VLYHKQVQDDHLRREYINKSVKKSLSEEATELLRTAQAIEFNSCKIYTYNKKFINIKTFDQNILLFGYLTRKI